MTQLSTTHVLDAGAAAVIVASWSGVVPVIAGVLGGIWYVCQIYNFMRKEFERRRSLRVRAQSNRRRQNDDAQA